MGLCWRPEPPGRSKGHDETPRSSEGAPCSDLERSELPERCYSRRSAPGVAERRDKNSDSRMDVARGLAFIHTAWKALKLRYSGVSE